MSQQQTQTQLERVCPYPGLRPFRKDEDLLFFGRNAQIDEILLRLKTHQFLGVVGSSGCGKSSLIRAGVLPALESGLMGQLGSSWYVVDMKPGDAPLFNLAEALLESGVFAAGQAATAEAAALLAATLRQSDVSLVKLLQAKQLPRYTNVVILADQFEEVFRFQQRDPDEALAFVNLLLATAADRSVPVYVLLTMRSDFLGQCAVFPGLPEALNDSQFLCPRLTRTQLREAIQLPALGAGDLVEDDLAAQLVNDAGANSDQLPLIQHALSRLWHQQDEHLQRAAVASGTGLTLTLQQYRDSGGLVAGSAAQGNILSGHLDEVYRELGRGRDDQLSGVAAQRVAELLFRSLAERGSGGQLIRSPRLLSGVAEIVRRDGQSLEAAVADVVWVVEHFRRPDRSFLVPAVDKVGQLTAESLLDISHEALIRQWGKLSQTWLDDEEQSRRRYRRLVEAAEGERTAGLMQDPELSFLESWWRVFAPRPAWGEGLRPGSFERATEFLKRSREQLDANKRRHRNRLLVWGTLGLLLAGLLLWERSRSAWQAEGKNYATRFLASPAAFQEDLLKYREVALPELRKAFQRQGTDAVQQRERLHAAYGLARYVPTDELLTFLGTEAGRLDALEFDMLSRSLAALLQSLGRDTGQYVEQQLQLAVNDGDRQLELRWLMLGVALGETTRLDSYCAAKDDPSDATALMVDLAKIPIDVSWLSVVLRDQSRVRPATRYVLCLVLGGLQGSGVAARATLEELYRTAGDCGTHSAARWALLQQGVPSKSLDAMIVDRDVRDAEAGKRDWYVTGQAGTAAGLTMLRIPRVPEFRLGAVADDEEKNPGDEDSQQWTAADRESVGEFWMSDREVSREQFQAVCPEWQQETSKIAATDGRHPVREVNWYDTLLYCNRLSVQHGLPKYYEFDEGQYDWATGELKGGAKFPSIPNPAGGGYRLPTEREWEYACRALSSVDYSFGRSRDALDLFARWYSKTEPLACGSLRPNRWGLSDMHGNVWEWCWDRFDTTNEEVAETSRVLRGGSFTILNPGSLRCADRDYSSPDYRYNYYGFRISRTK